MHRYLITVAYHGRPFAGWQIQTGQDTVQGRLESAIADVFGQQTHVEGAGRTDAGVHALRQSAHFDVERWIPPRAVGPALNANLPDAIVVRTARVVPPDVHARFSAVGKRYVYRCLVTRTRPVLQLDVRHWVKVPLDVAAMRVAAGALVGEHDFAAFCTNPGYERRFGTVRRVDRIRVVRRGPALDVFVQGNGFLYNMVRTIAGTLIDVGRGRFDADDVRTILESRDRRRGGINAPARGLFLQRVLYPPLPESPAFEPRPADV